MMIQKMRIERDRFHYGNAPGAESDLVLDDNIWKAFGVWLNLLRNGLIEDEYNSYLDKRQVMFEDFALAAKERLNVLMK